ncbi:MAG TPA: gliding motility lipoprotein GldH [Bacteroidales bacterium]|jgi:gliding motility-associated lipoprotein GldH|nr:gliding motility lipoprotein GldH [Bacteroidales bacterium]
MIKETNRFISFVILVLALTSCNSNVVFTDSVAMKGNTWGLANIASFSFQVTDTLSSNNIYFIIRTGSSFPYRNIYLFVTTIAPGDKMITDTLQYELADEKGNWYGKGTGDIHELKLPYKSNIYFPSSGEWQVMIQHGMRMEDLRGVYDFGLRVEKNPKKNSGGGKK